MILHRCILAQMKKMQKRERLNLWKIKVTIQTNFNKQSTRKNLKWTCWLLISSKLQLHWEVMP